MKHISQPVQVLLQGLACLVFCASGLAQVMQQPGTFPHHRQFVDAQAPPETTTAPPSPSSSANKPPAAVAPPAPATNAAVPPSLLDKPAQPAKVNLNAGHLVVQADNSSLSQILHQVSTETGMTVDGFGRDERIFGTYGPGNPHDVLSALLDGSGYNVVMFGETPAGAPRQLTLSPRSGGASTGGIVNRAASQSDDDDADEDVQPVQSVEPAVQPGGPPPGQGPGGIRTPQQMLQELQRIRQQEQQQQPQQQP